VSQDRHHLQPGRQDSAPVTSYLSPKNLELIMEILSDNSYLIDIIFKYINLRLKKLFNTKLAINSNKKTTFRHTNNQKDDKKYFVLPYLHNIIERAVAIIKETSNYLIGFRCCNKLDNIIKAHKDAIEIMSNTNVVYKIHCKDCNVFYVGQTKKQVKTRIKKHRNNGRNKTFDNY